jgi:subtilisin family serine protease
MYKKISLLIFILASFLIAQSQSADEFYPKTLMLKLKSQNINLANAKGINHTEFNQLMHQLGKVQVERVFPNYPFIEEEVNQHGDSLTNLSLWYKITYDANWPETKLIEQLRRLSIFQYVERRGINRVFSSPNDPLIGNQFYLDKIQAFAAWDIETGDSTIVVGIVDTGIEKAHPDLVHGIAYNWLDTMDAIDNDNDGFVDNFYGWDVGNNDFNVQWNVLGHGTFVSGFVSAVPNNGIGIAGVGYNTPILPVKVDDSLGYLAKDYEGVVYAADHGAFVINCSWGGTFGSNYGREIVNYASINRGALVVAACGNSNNNVWIFPASYPNVLSCAATDSLDVRWSQSSYGTQVDLAAPGTAVYSTWINNSYSTSHGTSFSAPIIAGAAALVKSHFPSMTNLQVAEQLRVSADNIDTIAANISYNSMLGAGRLNLYKALTDTLKPSIRFKNIVHYLSGDTLFIYGDFTNYLSPSSSQLTAVLQLNSSYFMAIDPTFNLGVMNTLSSISNASQAFMFKILPNIPVNHNLYVKVLYNDTAYSGFEFFNLTFNSDLSIIDTNKITTSVNSHSTIGFIDGSRMIGNGFSYKNQQNILSNAGLIVGNAGNRISDNIYDANSYSDDFMPISASQKIIPPVEGDLMYLNIYNDNNAGFSKQNIEVHQYSHAFAQAPLDKVVFLRYKLFNKGSVTQNNLHIGLFADWDIYKSYANKSDYDTSLRLSYTYSSLGGEYTGIQLLTDSSANCYNFDNDGYGGSFSLYDGLMDFEKWDAMLQSRPQAGLSHAYGNDVSSLLSTGPFSLAAGDSLDLTFALLAGDYLVDIKNSAQAALDWFNRFVNIESAESYENIQLFQNQPNPFKDFTSLSFQLKQSQTVKITILDGQGKQLLDLGEQSYSGGNHSVEVDLSDFEAGIYYYQLTSENQCYSAKLVLVK